MCNAKWGRLQALLNRYRGSCTTHVTKHGNEEVLRLRNGFSEGVNQSESGFKCFLRGFMFSM